jgi:hypothetical protein
VKLCSSHFPPIENKSQYQSCGKILAASFSTLKLVNQCVIYQNKAPTSRRNLNLPNDDINNNACTTTTDRFPSENQQDSSDHLEEVGSSRNKNHTRKNRNDARTVLEPDALAYRQEQEHQAGQRRSTTTTSNSQSYYEVRAIMKALEEEEEEEEEQLASRTTGQNRHRHRRPYSHDKLMSQNASSTSIPTAQVVTCVPPSEADGGRSRQTLQ